MGKQSGECVESVPNVTKHSAPFKCMKPNGLEFPLTAQSTTFSKGLGRRHYTNKTIVQISDSDPFRGCLPVDPFEYAPLYQNHATPDEPVSIYDFMESLSAG